MAITTRAGKGDLLTHQEVDTNFTELDTRVDTLESAGGGSLFFIAEDQKGISNQGGTAPDTQPNSFIRELNTVTRNDISGASLLSNVITLPAGDYKVFAKVKNERVDAVKMWLSNEDLASHIIDSLDGYVSSSVSAVSVDQSIEGVFTLASSTNVALRQVLLSATTNVSLGRNAGLAGPAYSLYAKIIIEKIS